MVNEKNTSLRYPAGGAERAGFFILHVRYLTRKKGFFDFRSKGLYKLFFITIVIASQTELVARTSLKRRPNDGSGADKGWASPLMNQEFF